MAALLRFLGGLFDGWMSSSTNAIKAQSGDVIVYSESSQASFLRSRIDPALRSTVESVPGVESTGGIGVVQPMSMTFVHGHDLREGLRLIRRLTGAPIGFNAIVEKSSRAYEDRMRRWVDVAVERGGDQRAALSVTPRPL